MVELQNYSFSDWIRGYRNVNNLLSCIVVICFISSTVFASTYATIQESAFNQHPQVYQANHRTLPEGHVSNLTNSHDQAISRKFKYELPAEVVQQNQTKESAPAKISKNAITSNGTQIVEDELNTSDSQLNPFSFNAELDEELEQPAEEDQPEEGETHNESASSQLSEQRVVKELKKIISKGMSGATDKVKLETLENWKAKQEERRAIKDSRAKLFEDLLTTAINSHPEKVRSKGKNREQKATDSTPKGEDAELGDYDTVFHHLSHLVTSMDKNRSPAIENFQPPEEYAVDDASEIVASDDKNSESASEGKSRKKEVDSNERPIIKKFKKIKKQISQRRKQLDQIKNMFNIDLSLNPKDGSLVGKPSKKKQITSSLPDEESQFDDISTGGRHKRKSSIHEKNGKLQELMSYLRENPEILASVMDELTSGSSSRKSSLITDENSSPVPDSTLDDLSAINFYNQNRINSLNLRKQQELAGLSWPRSRRSHRDLSPTLKQSRLKSQLDGLYEDKLKQQSNLSSFALPKTLSSESLLLRSLRERQLMNLARLDMVLASRQNATNRSYIYSALNSTSNPSVSRLDNSTERGGLMMNQHRAPKSNQPRHVFNGSSDNELHHYMVMNPDQREVLSLEKQIVGDSSLAHERPQFLSQSPSDPNVRYNQRTRYQSLPDALSRFNNWRDVSQSEASLQQRVDRINNNPMNAIWVPYDLATGGSSATGEDHKSASSTQNYRTQMRYPEDSAPPSNESQPVFQNGFFNQSSRGYVDSSVTKPGQQLSANYRPDYQSTKPSKIATNAPLILRNNIVNHESSNIDPQGGRSPQFAIKQSPSLSPEHEDTDGALEDAIANEDDPLMSDQNKVQTAGPTDYFSAYKQSTSGDNQEKNIKSSALFGFKKRQQKIPESRGGDDMGAIWA